MLEISETTQKLNFENLCQEEKKILESSKSILNALISIQSSSKNLIKSQNNGEIKDEVFQELNSKSSSLIANLEKSRHRCK